jgi:hypothetical protein
LNERVGFADVESKVFAKRFPVYPHAVRWKAEDARQRPLGATAQVQWFEAEIELIRDERSDFHAGPPLAIVIMVAPIQENLQLRLLDL